jgi:hypothetical protein
VGTPKKLPEVKALAWGRLVALPLIVTLAVGAAGAGGAWLEQAKVEQHARATTKMRNGTFI